MLHSTSVVRSNPDDRFRRRLFWRALPPLLVPLALAVLVVNPRHFQLDRELIGELVRARTPRELEEELRAFTRDFRNRSWLRGRMRLRVSTRRLRSIAARCLPIVVSNP